MKTKILIADAHTLTREGLKSLLSKRGDLQICGEAKNSSDLVDKINATIPNIVIIDFFIPNYFNIGDIAYIKENFPHINILVVTTNQSKQDVLQVLDYGVKSYLLKECDEDEIMNAISALMVNEKFFCGRVMDVILEKVTHNCSGDSICNHCQPVSLSYREVEVVKLIAESFTTKDIAQKLNVSYHTVSTHRKNIFKKLSIRSASELIVYAIKEELIKP